ncbi:MAG: DUF748 domain-containing protein [Sulfuriferula sp.]
MRFNARKVFLGLPFLICAGLFIAYLLFGYFAVNLLAQRILPWVAETKLDSRASVGQVDFDPLRLTVNVDNFRLTEPNGAPLAGFKRLHLDLEASGLFRFAWKLRDIELIAPTARFDIAPGGKLNWARLIAALNKDKTPPSKTLPRVLIEHLKITQGDIEYTDRNRPTPFEASLFPLGLQLDGLSTLPADRGNYLIAAKLPKQGGTLKWDGKLGLNPVVSTGRVALEGVKLAQLMRVVRQSELPFTPTAGVLDTRLMYSFTMVKDQPQAVLTQIALSLKDFAATAANGATQLTAQQLIAQVPRVDFAIQSGTQLRFKGLTAQLTAAHFNRAAKPLFDLAQARVSGVDFDLATQRAQVAQVTLTGGNIHASRSADGVIDWQQALVPQATSTATSAVASAAATIPSRPFVFNIATVQLHDWQAHYLDHSFRHALSADVTGFNLDFVVSNASGALQLSGLNSMFGPLTLGSALSNKPIATLQQLRIENGALDLAKHAVTLDAIVASGLHTDILEQIGKPLTLQAAFEPLKPVAKPTDKHDSKTAKPAAWTLALQRAALEDTALHFEDRAKGKPVVLDIEQANLAAHNLSLDLRKPISVTAAFKVKQGGSFDAHGTLVPEPLRGDLKLKFSALSLKPFAPYLNRIARLNLNSGSASSSGMLKLQHGKKLAINYAGSFAVDKLGITEEEGGAQFLGWQRLSSDDLTFRLAPDSLHIGTLRAVKPVGKIIIFADKTLNLTRLLRREAPPPVAPVVGAEPPDAAPIAAKPIVITRTAPAKDAFPINIERIRIDNADLEFADLSLTPQFGTNINSLSGVINGLSTNPATVSQVELDGKVDQYGSARIRGSLQPFHATDFTDLKLSFRNLEMNRLTPYSGKFAGRKILSGTLSVDLEYKIKNRLLSGENQFIMNKLQLGEHVDSPDAMHLPLDLAIALLQDSNGVINLNLPVSGNLDDPQFSYGRIVWKAIVNVLTKLVTAPFRALGNLLGISSDKLQTVAFDAGSAVLLPPEQEKLKSVAQAMSKRPALTLTVEPAYASTADTRAIETQWIRRDVAQGMGLKLAANEAPGPVDLTNPKVQKAVLSLAKARLKPDLFKQIKADYDKPKADGSTRDGALLEQLTLQIPVTDAELQRLAQQRGEAIKQVLLANGVTPDHLSVAAPVAGSAADQMVNTKLSLGASQAATPSPVPAPAVGQPKSAE